MTTNEFFVHERPDGRWIIVNALNTLLAWTGHRWAGHRQGFPSTEFKISNFDSANEARQAAVAQGLDPERLSLRDGEEASRGTGA